MDVPVIAEFDADQDLALVVKVSERCNIACDYCYMYQFDEAWQERPRLLSDEHTERLIQRVSEYLEAHPKASIVLELHGGEPLLWGKRRFAKLIQNCADFRQVGRLDIVVQTNGTLLDESWMALLIDQRIPWSISCDGPPQVNDRHRLTRSGRSTASAVEDAVKRSVEFGQGLFGGVLAVGDLNVDPRIVFDYFRSLGVHAVDLLLPDTTRVEAVDIRWGSWLRRMFDCWLEYDDPDFDVRTAHSFAAGVLGRASFLDAFGGDISGLLTVETDGTVQMHDVLRICGSDVPDVGASLESHTLEQVLSTVRQRLPEKPSVCKSCRALGTCGGGYLPHRWNGSDFSNPSAYCAPLLALHDHVTIQLMESTAPNLWHATT